jgi:hypothetical protein
MLFMANTGFSEKPLDFAGRYCCNPRPQNQKWRVMRD